jgi:hypothetical protein
LAVKAVLWLSEWVWVPAAPRAECRFVLVMAVMAQLVCCMFWAVLDSRFLVVSAFMLELLWRDLVVRLVDH